ALFLEAEKHAKERKASVYGQIKGYGITSDAYKLAGNNPNGKAYSYAMSDALKESELSVDDIDAIFSDARGLRSMDLTEVNAIRHLGGAKILVTTLSNNNG
ncbi:beta-ketoacyl synthase, partial [Priestia megaterium]